MISPMQAVRGFLSLRPVNSTLLDGSAVSGSANCQQYLIVHDH